MSDAPNTMRVISTIHETPDHVLGRVISWNLKAMKVAQSKGHRADAKRHENTVGRLHEEWDRRQIVEFRRRIAS